MCGDALFFLADFKGAAADYAKMVELDPAQDASHWRRGIAEFYAGDFEGAAKQFEKYHSFDDVDRENGIWRYFSQHKAHGAKKAQEGLLKYRKTDREPFPSVYQLFSKELTSEEVLRKVAEADISDDDREVRDFYAQLYVGLNHALEGRDELALKHLRVSTANKWGPQAGYGPRYMWHVGRLHFELLQVKARDASKK
jgi:lipoprotein NlpI